VMWITRKRTTFSMILIILKAGMHMCCSIRENCRL